MASYRKKYFEDYEVRKVPKENGTGYKTEYIYTGIWCRWTEAGHSTRFLKLRCAAIEAANVLVFLCTALLQTPFTRDRLAGGFGLLSILAWIFELAGVIRFLLAGEWVKELTQNEVDTRIRAGGMIRCVLLMLGAVCGVISLLTGSGMAALDWLAAAGFLACAALSFALSRLHKRLQIEVSKHRD